MYITHNAVQHLLDLGIFHDIISTHRYIRNSLHIL